MGGEFWVELWTDAVLQRGKACHVVNHHHIIEPPDALYLTLPVRQPRKEEEGNIDSLGQLSAR
jgi:hypothetical protein